MRSLREQFREQRLAPLGPNFTPARLFAIALLSSVGLFAHGAFLQFKSNATQCISFEYTNSTCRWESAPKIAHGGSLLSDGCVWEKTFTLIGQVPRPVLSYRLAEFDYAESPAYNDTVALYSAAGALLCDTAAFGTDGNPLKRGMRCAKRGIAGLSKALGDEDNALWRRRPALRSMRRPLRVFDGPLPSGTYSLVVRDRFHVNARKFIEIRAAEDSGVHPLVGKFVFVAGGVLTGLTAVAGALWWIAGVR